jgi:hypothetical protein
MKNGYLTGNSEHFYVVEQREEWMLHFMKGKPGVFLSLRTVKWDSLCHSSVQNVINPSNPDFKQEASFLFRVFPTKNLNTSFQHMDEKGIAQSV